MDIKNTELNREVKEYKKVENIEDIRKRVEIRKYVYKFEDQKKDTTKNLIREPELNNKETFPDICVCCGAPVPEGYMICPECERKSKE